MAITRLERGDAILRRLGVPTTRKIVGAEIGIFTGDLSEYLLCKCSDIVPNLILYMIDAWPEEKAGRDSHGPVGGKAERRIAIERTASAHERRYILHGDSVDVSHRVPNESLEFAFIDGCHAYKAVIADIHAWQLKVKVGGWLCGHDCKKSNDVHRAVSNSVGTFEADGDSTWFWRKPANW